MTKFKAARIRQNKSRAEQGQNGSKLAPTCPSPFTSCVLLPNTSIRAQFTLSLYQMDTAATTVWAHKQTCTDGRKSHRWCKFTTTNWPFSGQSASRTSWNNCGDAITPECCNWPRRLGQQTNRGDTHLITSTHSAQRKLLQVGSSVCPAANEHLGRAQMYIVRIEMWTTRGFTCLQIGVCFNTDVCIFKASSHKGLKTNVECLEVFLVFSLLSWL